MLLSEMWLPEELVVRYSEDEQLSATRIGEPYFIITATWADMSGDFTEHFSLLGAFDNFETNVTVHLHQGKSKSSSKIIGFSISIENNLLRH